ncbi:CRISPR-associated endonuclease Cas1 [Raineyella sp.]|uniref:CRISPR-associated endonuclease Cas1 n=1 Tax=Raineyella sp. TaxID=1911550 RepID=UPI002B20CBF5|nr:CRISPR-associated endonuclease Cas1 [Raineyella sp.]MEA5153438.1 CRISPR-associated endonuclease Cas1 [Raineyella sp.]
MAEAKSEPIPISLVCHTVFCPRRAWLEAAGEVVDSFQMESGSSSHKRVDDPAQGRPGQRRAVDIHHRELGLVGKCDLVHSDPDEGVRIVEYKATPVRRTAAVTEPQEVQLALQRMCLESMGVAVHRTGVYFTTHETYVDVPFGLESDLRAIHYIDETRAILASRSAPPPLVNDEKCRFCSHASVCLPDEMNDSHPARSISVADPNAEIVHLLTYGSRAQIRSGRVEVVKGDEHLASLPLERVAGLVIHGNSDVSSALIREMLWRDATIVWCSGSGRVVGWSRSGQSPHGQERVTQYLRSHRGDLALAREFITCKISNQATLLRRNGRLPPDNLKSLRSIQRKTLTAHSGPELFALEGEAAALYFSAFPTMLKGQAGLGFAAEWTGRDGRHATDPLNAALNFAYGLLVSDTIRSIAACGLDPSAGFLHSSSRNKPALALDLMEEFRAPVADSAVITAINNGALTTGMFTSSLGDCRLKESGRKAIVGAYERRIQTVGKHPLFGYQVSWQRTIEVQARMILGVLEGSRSQYQGIRTR